MKALIKYSSLESKMMPKGTLLKFVAVELARKKGEGILLPHLMPSRGWVCLQAEGSSSLELLMIFVLNFCFKQFILPGKSWMKIF
jgi:hypothetical protein